jgi:cytochrome P450
MNAIARIKDYSDPSFDPFAVFDVAQGFGEVDDPYPTIHKLHARGTVHRGDLREQFGLQPFTLWSDLPSVMVLGHDLVERVYADGATFSNAIMQRLYADSFGQSINGMDAPEHPRYRRLFQKAFMPQTVARWGNSLVPAVVSRIIDDFADRGRAELVSEFTSRYPFEVIYAQLALPANDLSVFHRLAVGLMCITVDYPHALEASRNMGEYFDVLLQERRRQAPGDDLVGMLAHAEAEGERLPDEVAVSFLRQLMNAAGDTTYRSTGSLLVGLLTHPEQLEAVRADRSLLPGAIDEALRWDGPLTVLTRQAMRDVELDGVAVASGTKIDVVQGSANRDPARHKDPDRFDITRPPARHMAFAYGPHVCIGLHLARLEMQRALTALLDRLPDLRLDPDFPPPRVVGFNSRAPQAIHVRFDPIT